MAMIWNDMHLRVLTMKLDFGFRRLRIGLGMLAAGFLLAGPLVAQRTERSTLDITGYVIDAEIDTTTHHLQAKAIVSFNPPENAEMVRMAPATIPIQRANCDRDNTANEARIRMTPTMSQSQA